MIIANSGQTELLKMLIASVESLPWTEIYAGWCGAGYNHASSRLPSGTIITTDLSITPGQKEHPRLINIVQGQLRRAGFVVEPTRNWGNKSDMRMGLKLKDQNPQREGGEVNITLLGYGWVETHVRIQYLLHMLGIDTKWSSNEC